MSTVRGHLDLAAKGLPPSPRLFMQTQIMPRERNVVSQENLPLTKESPSFFILFKIIDIFSKKFRQHFEG